MTRKELNRFGENLGDPAFLKTLHVAFKTVFEGDNGKLVKQYLEWKYASGTTLAAEPIMTHAREAQRAVVLDIEGMCEEEEDAGRIDTGTDSDTD